MAVAIDGVLKEWGDRLYCINTRARPAPKNVCGYRPRQVTQATTRNTTADNVRAALKRTVRKVPEVMVKISGSSKAMSRIKAHFDYISRNGDVPLENEAGQTLQGKQALGELREDWKLSADGATIPHENGYRREAFNIVLSMPPGTDREAVHQAAREFAKANFDGYMYVFAAHNDEKHPHVHLCVKAVGRGMVRLNPRKADLQVWRESFAEKLRAHGIEANATPRALRGKARRADKQAVLHIEKRGATSWTKAERAKAVTTDIAAQSPGMTEYDAKIEQQRKTVMERYGTIAKALAESTLRDDRHLAIAITQHVAAMPAAKTQHRLAVEHGVTGSGLDRQYMPNTQERETSGKQQE